METITAVLIVVIGVGLASIHGQLGRIGDAIERLEGRPGRESRYDRDGDFMVEESPGSGIQGLAWSVRSLRASLGFIAETARSHAGTNRTTPNG